MNKDSPSSEFLGWYVWTIRPDKYYLVEKYIQEKVPEVKRMLYPTVTTEKTSKKGLTRKKRSPLYAGYLFLQYNHDLKNPITWIKLNNYPFIKSYVGPCTAEDLASVDSLQKSELFTAYEKKSFFVGDKVRVSGGIFVGYEGSVTKLTGNFVNVELRQDGAVFNNVVFSPEDLDIVERPQKRE